jgi:hypothetical protein
MAALWRELHGKNFGNTETFAILPVANCWSITCRLEALSFPLIAKMKRQEMLPNDFRFVIGSIRSGDHHRSFDLVEAPTAPLRDISRPISRVGCLSHNSVSHGFN